MTEPQELTFVPQFHRFEPRITAPLFCGCNVSWKVALGTAGLATHGVNKLSWFKQLVLTQTLRFAPFSQSPLLNDPDKNVVVRAHGV